MAVSDQPNNESLDQSPAADEQPPADDSVVQGEVEQQEASPSTEAAPDSSPDAAETPQTSQEVSSDVEAEPVEPAADQQVEDMPTAEPVEEVTAVQGEEPATEGADGAQTNKAEAVIEEPAEEAAIQDEVQLVAEEAGESEIDGAEAVVEAVVEETPVEVAPIEEAAEEPAADEERKDWYILKVQVNREDSIREALLRRIKIEGLEEFFGDIVVPVEEMAEFNKSGKRRIVKKKLYPGYILVNMTINDETWFVVRETPGVGDFTGSAGKPTPMEQREVERILKIGAPEEGAGGQVKTAIPFKAGDRVRVKDGYFQNFEGDVEEIDEANGRITVMINIFGRSTPVELEHWQVEAL